MPTTVKVGGTNRPILRVTARVGGVNRTIQRIWAMVGGTARLVYQFFSVQLNNTNATGSYNGPSGLPQDITTNAVRVVVSGGEAPFTYAWELTSVSAYTWVFTASTGSATALTCEDLTAGAIDSINFRCVVTDDNSIVAYTNEGTATAFNNSTV